MGILDKVMFWKKKDEFSDIGLGDKDNLAFGNEFGQPAPGTNPPGLGANPGLDQNQGLGQDPGMQPGLGQQPPQSMPQPSMPSFSAPPPQQSYDPVKDMTSKNLEIISSKLDAIRASLDNLNQRLGNLEAIARGDEEDSRRKRYY